jgi:hypothetical protein
VVIFNISCIQTHERCFKNVGLNVSARGTVSSSKDVSAVVVLDFCLIFKTHLRNLREEIYWIIWIGFLRRIL